MHGRSLLALLAGGCSAPPPADLPNVVIIVTDDQGFADVGAFGSGSAPEGPPWNAWDSIPIPTPRLDTLAEQGMRLTAFYSGHHRCTPSRAALLTGAYPSRVGFGSVVVFPEDTHGLNPNEITLAEMLQARGYATGLFGKWHLGHEQPYLPLQQGFDTFVGIPYSHNLWADPALPLANDVVFNGEWTAERYEGLLDRSSEVVQSSTNNLVALMRGNEVAEFPMHNPSFTERITDEAIQFVRDHRDEPFFLYVPHTMPHVPLGVTPAFQGVTERGPYGNAVAEIDHHVGRLVDAIDEEDLGSSTLVLFTSDNGPWLSQGDRAGTAYPFRGGKSSHLEGGFRVPTIARWPGRVPAGSEQTEVASFLDIFPTVAALSGGGLPRDRVYDGFDITALLESTAAASPHDTLFYNVGAVRQGRWKFVEGALFDLSEDLSESNDLSRDEPDVAATLGALLEEHRDTQATDGRPLGSLDTVPLRAGCTDRDARNFDRRAEIDDGSCRYRT